MTQAKGFVTHAVMGLRIRKAAVMKSHLYLFSSGFNRGKVLERRVLLLLLFLFLQGCASGGASRVASKPGSNPSFTGLWVVPETDKTSFELDLVQTGTAVEGYHAALVGKTAQIEAALRSDREPPSVYGRIGSEGKALVQFQLRKGAGAGEALLTLNGDKLRWKLVSSSGASLLPKSCVLFRQGGAAH